MPFDHSHICQFAPSDDEDEEKIQIQKPIIEFIRSVLKDAKQSIEERFEASTLHLTQESKLSRETTKHIF